MTRLAVGAGLLVWVGATLLLSSWARVSRPSLLDRLRPFSPGGTGTARRGGVLSVESLSDAAGPLARAIGDRAAALSGVGEPLAARLRRVHSTLGPSQFRARQLAISGVALLAGCAVAAAGVPAPLAVLAVAGAPVLAFLMVEQRLARASERWQRDLEGELPVLGEQLAMLLNAGFSLRSALARIAARGRGCAARDLSGVVNRVRQGLAEPAALREWADIAKVDGVERLVGVLAVHAEASDLGRLVSAEARQARRDLQRRTTEAIERRAQQVWVPVTVATLVPGVILLAVPFLAALRLFSNA
ncbi:MAG: type II secretion system F family protein [Acidimicrobiales bacterium]